MDGNGRWAKARGLPRTEGHARGEASLFDVIEGAIEIGQRVELTAREWAVLEALVLRAGRTVSAPDLQALVLGLDNDLHSNALQVHVFHLRSKLGKDLIQTVRGLGYRMVAPGLPD